MQILIDCNISEATQNREIALMVALLIITESNKERPITYDTTELVSLNTTDFIKITYIDEPEKKTTNNR